VCPALAHLNEQTGKRGSNAKDPQSSTWKLAQQEGKNSIEGVTFRQGERTLQGNDSGTRKQLQKAFLLGSLTSQGI
jgi:hypothetical protein